MSKDIYDIDDELKYIGPPKGEMDEWSKDAKHHYLLLRAFTAGLMYGQNVTTETDTDGKQV